MITFLNIKVSDIETFLLNKPYLLIESIDYKLAKSKLVE